MTEAAGSARATTYRPRSPARLRRRSISASSQAVWCCESTYPGFTGFTLPGLSRKR
jgi:hypothetical protein